MENTLFESVEPSPKDEAPTMDWLTDSLAKNEDSEEKDINENLYIEEHDPDGFMGDIPIPTTGISVADEMEKTQKERFFTEVVRIKGLEPGVRAAQIVTTTTTGSFEPVRYVLALSKHTAAANNDSSDDDTSKPAGLSQSFVLVDVPPFSDQLVRQMRDFMGPNGKLVSILVTSKDSIHYDEAPGVFAIRRADLVKWEKAFPDTAIVAYRMDIPRDCRDSVSQRLDGYGPFALDETSSPNATFVESGRPLTYKEWDYDMTQDIFAGKKTPPDDEPSNATAEEIEIEADLYSAEAIRAREEGKRVLAVYTPGRTYGSISYVFPEVNLIASGFTIPIEDSRNDENIGIESAGPALDVRGYITTSKAGIARQMESARNLIESYVDRFTVILPSRSDPYFVDGKTEERKQDLLAIVGQYEKIGKIYERLGITSYDDDDEEDI